MRNGRVKLTPVREPKVVTRMHCVSLLFSIQWSGRGTKLWRGSFYKFTKNLTIPCDVERLICPSNTKCDTFWKRTCKYSPFFARKVDSLSCLNVWYASFNKYVSTRLARICMVLSWICMVALYSSLRGDHVLLVEEIRSFPSNLLERVLPISRSIGNILTTLKCSCTRGRFLVVHVVFRVESTRPKCNKSSRLL